MALRALLDALDPQPGEALVLTQLVGLSYAEAAEVCGCPLGTIRSGVARARADLVAGFGARRQFRDGTSGEWRYRAATGSSVAAARVARVTKCSATNDIVGIVPASITTA